MPEPATGPISAGSATTPIAPPPRPRRARSHLVAGGAVLAVYALVAILGPWLAPYGANDQDLLDVLAPATSAHWLGTDQIGRDLFSRLLVGTRFTLVAALISVALAAAGG